MNTKKSFFTFSDRLGRLDFIRWQVMIQFGFFLLNVVLVSVVFKYLDSSSIYVEKIITSSFLLWLGSFYITCLFLSIRRLNDLNQSAWWSLIYLFPILSICLLMYLFFAPSFPLNNKYGPPPLSTPVEKSILWFILGCIILVFSFCLFLITTMVYGAP